jgi:fused signal recognition particle receptor
MTDIFNKWKEGLSKTSKTKFGQIATFFGATEITPDTWDELEAMLIQADLGIDTTDIVIRKLKSRVEKSGWTKTEQLRDGLHLELSKLLKETPHISFDPKPFVILIVGVNGSGKTTTIAKLAALYKKDGKNIIIGAADTFRAAAIDQLQAWTEKLDIPIITGQPGGDAGAVAYDTVNAGVARNMDIILIDTAGRLHTRFNLMEELKKVYRVTGKALSGAPHAVWLVLDSTTGQNALQQAKAFKEVVNVTGIILAKLDSSAHGGMAFAIQQELDLPILYAGLGEKAEDIKVFNKDAFIEGILNSWYN